MWEMLKWHVFTQCERPGGECGVTLWERSTGEESVGSLSGRGQEESVGSLNGTGPQERRVWGHSVGERLQECEEITCWLGDIRK